MTVTPEVNKMAVFSKGCPYGLIAIISVGGHTIPVLIVGVHEYQKNAQKNPKKNKTSDAINTIIAIRIESVVCTVCWPELDSRVTSRHHINVDNRTSATDSLGKCTAFGRFFTR